MMKVNHWSFREMWEEVKCEDNNLQTWSIKEFYGINETVGLLLNTNMVKLAFDEISM